MAYALNLWDRIEYQPYLDILKENYQIIVGKEISSLDDSLCTTHNQDIPSDYKFIKISGIPVKASPILDTKSGKIYAPDCKWINLYMERAYDILWDLKSLKLEKEKQKELLYQYVLLTQFSGIFDSSTKELFRIHTQVLAYNFDLDKKIFSQIDLKFLPTHEDKLNVLFTKKDQSVEGYNVLVRSLDAEEVIKFSNNRIFNILKLEGQGFFTKIFSFKEAKNLVIRVPKFSGPIDYRKSSYCKEMNNYYQGERLAEEINKITPLPIPKVFHEESYPCEYILVEKIHNPKSLHDLYYERNKFKDLTKEDEHLLSLFVDAAVQFWPFERLSDAKPDQFVFGSGKWWLVDFDHTAKLWDELSKTMPFDNSSDISGPSSDHNQDLFKEYLPEKYYNDIRQKIIAKRNDPNSHILMKKILGSVQKQ